MTGWRSAVRLAGWWSRVSGLTCLLAGHMLAWGPRCRRCGRKATR